MNKFLLWLLANHVSLYVFEILNPEKQYLPSTKFYLSPPSREYLPVENENGLNFQSIANYNFGNESKLNIEDSKVIDVSYQHQEPPASVSVHNSFEVKKSCDEEQEKKEEAKHDEFKSISNLPVLVRKYSSADSSSEEIQNMKEELLISYDLNDPKVTANNVFLTTTPITTSSSILKKDFRYISPPASTSYKNSPNENKISPPSSDSIIFIKKSIPSVSITENSFQNNENSKFNLFNSINDVTFRFPTSTPLPTSLRKNEILSEKQNDYALSVPSYSSDSKENVQTEAETIPRKHSYLYIQPPHYYTDTIYKSDGYHYQRPLINFEDLQQ